MFFFRLVENISFFNLHKIYYTLCTTASPLQRFEKMAAAITSLSAKIAYSAFSSESTFFQTPPHFGSSQPNNQARHIRT